MKTIAIVGAGPGLGLAIARKFGREGFQVALLARRQESLDQLVESLGKENIAARGFVADIRDQASLEKAFAEVKTTLGPVEVMEFSPISMEFIPPSEISPQVAFNAFQFQYLGAVISVQQVLPDMLNNGSGALLFTGGRSAILPMARLGSLGPMASAMRNYAYTLNEELGEKGIYAGTITVCCFITPNNVDAIADQYWSMYQKRNRVEEIFGENIAIEGEFPVRC